jgi:hypothetical protein
MCQHEDRLLIRAGLVFDNVRYERLNPVAVLPKLFCTWRCYQYPPDIIWAALTDAQQCCA